MAGPRPTFIADADIHALVDGRLEADRRADTLRRLAGSPTARARVEAWQGQNDLLRSAFAGIEREPLPALLDLRAKSRLQCVPANDPPLVGPTPEPPPSRARRAFAGIATLVLVCVGLGASWSLLQSEVEAPVASAPLRGSVDATLAGLSTDALGRQTLGASPTSMTDGLPTTDIPDLHAAGYGFAGAEPAADSILFRYRNGAEKIVVSVARSASGDATPARVGDSYVWHKAGKAFALAGTARPAKLREIAVALAN